MLNKEICKKCRNENAEEFNIPEWNKATEENWNKGMIWCCFYDVAVPLFSIRENPPDKCCYRLEHIISDVKQKNL